MFFTLGCKADISVNLLNLIENIFANYANCKSTHSFDNNAGIIKTGIKLKHFFAAAFSLGYRFDRTIPYIKIGVSSAKWELSNSYTTKIIGPNFAPTAPLKTVSSNKAGLLLGAGADMFITPQFKLGFEYNHIRYANMSMVNDRNKLSIKPRTNSFMLRAAWVI
jgi:opacity protein-like surface antigen